MLRRLEHHKRKDRILVEDCTIEHIMPQNKDLSQQWRLDLGKDWKDIHKNYLHTLGNLTLTFHNPTLSDKPFSEKRDMKGGFKSSSLKLNQELGAYELWNKEAISKRSNELAEAAKEIWSAP